MPSLLPVVKELSVSYRLEQIIVYLAESILDYQKEGPFYLGGWSASGVVAYETARQLADMGHEVALLAMFDTANPAFQQRALKEFWLDSRAKKIRFLAKELWALKPEAVPVYAADKVKEFRRKIHVAASQIQYKTHVRLDDPEQILQLAVSSYRPSPYSGRLVFFKPTEGAPGDAWDLSRGWPQVIKGEFDVCEVPGDHRSMFREPNVQILAAKMMKYL